MKYLRPYKMFESVEDDFGKIRDILSDLMDNGFVYNIIDNRTLKTRDKRPIIQSLPIIQVYISAEEDADDDYITPFSYNDISSDVDELISQLSDDYDAEIVSSLDWTQKGIDNSRRDVYISDDGVIRDEYKKRRILSEIQIDFYKK